MSWCDYSSIKRQIIGTVITTMWFPLLLTLQHKHIKGYIDRHQPVDLTNLHIAGELRFGYTFWLLKCASFLKNTNGVFQRTPDHVIVANLLYRFRPAHLDMFVSFTETVKIDNFWNMAIALLALALFSRIVQYGSKFPHYWEKMPYPKNNLEMVLRLIAYDIIKLVWIWTGDSAWKITLPGPFTTTGQLPALYCIHWMFWVKYTLGYETGRRAFRHCVAIHNLSCVSHLIGHHSDRHYLITSWNSCILGMMQPLRQTSFKLPLQ